MMTKPTADVLDLAHVRLQTELHLRGLEAVCAELSNEAGCRARRHTKRLESIYQSVLSARANLQLALRDLDRQIGRKG